MKVQSIYSNKILLKGLKFAAGNGALFGATASLAFSTIRPLIILATPDTNKQNKQIAGTKAIASSLIGFVMMLAASLPVSKAVKNIDSAPQRFLKKSTINFLQSGEKTLSASSKYSFASQLIKLGLGAVLTVPKSIFTFVLIPPIMTFLFKKRNPQLSQQKENTYNNKPPFTGISPKKPIDKLSKFLANFIDSKPVHNLTDKFHKTKFEQHITAVTDTIATGAFIAQAAESKKINPNDKKMLIYNSIISTVLSLAGMYSIDKLTEKPTQKFVENFKKANLKSPELNKYLEGIKIAKPLLILGSIYYILIPLLSVFTADKLIPKNNR